MSGCEVFNELAHFIVIMAHFVAIDHDLAIFGLMVNSGVVTRSVVDGFDGYQVPRKAGLIWYIMSEVPFSELARYIQTSEVHKSRFSMRLSISPSENTFCSSIFA